MRARLFLGGALLLAPLMAWGQTPQPDDPAADGPPPLTITFVEGGVDVARDAGVQPATAPDLLADGDRLLTTSGRAELVFADGSVVHVDHDSDLHVDGSARLRLVRGHVIVHTSAASIDLIVALPAGLVRLDPRGEYDLSASDLDGDSVAATVRGQATLLTATGEIPIAADNVLHLDPRDPRPRWARAYAIRSPLGDWASSRMNEATAAMRGQPLPPPLAPYASEFAEHGRWATEAPYGNVWIPAVVSDWRPYGAGSWRYTRYGWTWIDSDPWAWPMHHYGRWGRRANGGWFWIPRAAWGPAWVSWAIGADHIGWAPMGWDSRPVVDFFAGARLGPVDLWASTWSLVPRQSFGVRGLIGPHLQDLRYLPGPVLGGFVVQSHQPRGGRDGWRGGSGGSWPERRANRTPRVNPLVPSYRMPQQWPAPPAARVRPRDERGDAPAPGALTLPRPSRGSWRDDDVRDPNAPPPEHRDGADRPAPGSSANDGAVPRARRDGGDENRGQRGAGASAAAEPRRGSGGSMGAGGQRRAESGDDGRSAGRGDGRGEARARGGESGSGSGASSGRGGGGNGGGTSGGGRAGHGGGGGGGVRRPR